METETSSSSAHSVNYTVVTLFYPKKIITIVNINKLVCGLTKNPWPGRKQMENIINKTNYIFNYF